MFALAAALPRHFCWTRFGTEAGQSVEQILLRKEEERRRNGGIFLWGIGNSLGASIDELVRRAPHPEVLFSPIKGTPRPCDSDPQEVLAWRCAETLRGEQFVLPPWSLVTSRQYPDRPKTAHYALVCHSSAPLLLATDGPSLDFAYLRNIITGHRLGASQVTATVERGDHPIGTHREYRVALRADLIAPFFIRLRSPMSIPAQDEIRHWGDAVMTFWSGNASKRSAMT